MWYAVEKYSAIFIDNDLRDPNGILETSNFERVSEKLIANGCNDDDGDDYKFTVASFLLFLRDCLNI